MVERFADKVALVTGGRGGIGSTTVKRLRQEGCIVYSADLTADDADPYSIVLDVADKAQWEKRIKQIVGEHGHLNVLVNNAAIRESNLAENTSPDQWQRHMDIVLTGAFLGCATVIPHMREIGGGAIVNVSSINGIRGNRNMIAYGAAKGGVVSMTASLALDHAVDNIRVNAVCPGAIQTAMLDGYFDDVGGDREAVIRSVAARHALHRLGQPEEVASVIAFLASEDASFMTGLAIPVDGGRSV